MMLSFSCYLFIKTGERSKITLKLMSVAIGENFKKIRLQRNLTLDAVSELTGVSKSMLGQIERGTANPTISTIWKICSGMKVPYSSIMSMQMGEENVLSENNVSVIISDDELYENVQFFPFDGKRNFEIDKITIKPTGVIETGPHPAGTVEYLIVFEGEVALEHNGRTDIIRKNQAYKFSSDVPHKGYNIGKTDARMAAIVSYDPVIKLPANSFESQIIFSEDDVDQE